MRVGEIAKTATKWVKRQHWLLKALALVALAAVLVFVISGRRSGEPRREPEFPASGPAEFLYLDGARVLAYLAQFDGGNFTSSQLTSTTSNSQNSKISVQDAFELGEASEQAQSVSKTITPTAAGNYIELLSKLEGLHGLKKIGLGRFQHEVGKLTEGQFVTFRTHALSSPVYLNPYLAVRQRRTVSTLFPMPREGEAKRKAVHRERVRARLFRDQVGKDPRVVFALRPVNAKERAERESELGGGTPAAPQVARNQAEERVQEKYEEEEHVEYLMPMDAELISQERSLLKFGGGEFTVVGKLVRVFPEDGNSHQPAYVDSPTLETWKQPLSEAPLQLLCRTDPECTERVRKDGATDREREEAVHHARAWALEALEEQTKIARRGAVIVPIAIYK